MHRGKHEVPGDLSGPTARVLETVGALARSDGEELAQRTALDLADVERALATLSAAGRITPGKGNTWEPLVSGLPEGPDWVRSLRSEFADSTYALSALPEVQVVVGARACLASHFALWRQVKSHALMLDRPPYAGDLPMPCTNEPETPEFAAVDRGVTIQAVYSPGFENLSRLWYLRHAVRKQIGPVRIGPVPLKLTLLDDQVAIIPVLRAYDIPGHLAGVVVTHPPLLQILRELFDAVWQAARPVPVAFACDIEDRKAETVTLLLAGLTDAAIGRELGVSERTVRRWVHGLLVDYGCETRLQLGAALAVRHDLPECLDPGPSAHSRARRPNIDGLGA